METTVVKKLNDTVTGVLTSSQLLGFEKAFQIADATAELKKALNDEYMKPIMALQGTKLGFKTDKDDKGGYPVEVVRLCLIEAVLSGVQPFGNQFNIIAGNSYITKEGYGHLLNSWPGLEWEIIPSLPRISQDKNSAAIVMKVNWTINGKKETRELDLAIRSNQYGSADSVTGKATRKARAWLHNKLSGIELGEGDVNDVAATVVGSTLTGITITGPTLEDLQHVFLEVEAELTKTEFDDAKRIMDNRENDSYSKLFRMMTSKIKPS